MNKVVSHICSIEKANSGSGLPPLPENATWWQKRCRNTRKYFLVSDRDPRIIEYFRTTSGLMEEKKRHVNSKYYYMIHPFSEFVNIHDTFMTVVLVIYFLVIPFLFTFVREKRDLLSPHAANIIASFVNIIFIGDIILNFFTGYVDPKSKTAVLEQSKVARHYLCGYFVFDVLSTLPTDILGYVNPDSNIIAYIHSLRVLRIVRFINFFQFSKYAAFFVNWNKTLLLCSRYILVVVLIAHWCTCVNFFVPHIGKALSESGTLNKYSWIIVSNLTSEEIFTKYIKSLFRTVGLLLCALNDQPDNFGALIENVRQYDKNTSIPFLEIFHSPIEEVLMDLFTIILGKILTAAFEVVIISRVSEIFTLETKYQGMMNQLNEFMKNKKLPMTMRDRLEQYYEHRYQRKFFKEEVISAILSENLRKEVNVNVCKQLVHIVNIFAELPPNILADVLGHLKAEVYLPNDIIIKAGTIGDCMYFLSTGTVSVYTPSGREVCHLEDGAYFGEISLILKNTKRTTDIIAIEVCEVYRLDKKAFRSCFKYDKYGVFDKMQQIAEQRLQRTALLEETYKLELFQKAYTEKQ